MGDASLRGEVRPSVAPWLVCTSIRAFLADSEQLTAYTSIPILIFIPMEAKEPLNNVQCLEIWGMAGCEGGFNFQVRAIWP